MLQRPEYDQFRNIRMQIAASMIDDLEWLETYVRSGGHECLQDECDAKMQRLKTGMEELRMHRAVAAI